MVQILYLSKQTRPIIQLEVSLLFTIVRETYTDDYKKTSRMMKYIQGTIGLTLILSIYKSGNIKWYDDAEFAVHKDMRRHNGRFMNMGTEGVYFQSIKKT